VIFPEVLGHVHARTVLARLLASDRLPHAFLFQGPEGVGKGLVARLFATSLVCAQPRSDATACGECQACRKAAHGNHPDILVVTRLPKKDSRADADAEVDDEDDGADEGAPARSGDLRPFIIVRQIRELNHHATYAPREGRRRVFIVDPADRMHAESQNALLKTLEEPVDRTVFVLVASRPHVLLPTVRSRCFQIGFGAMPAEALASALQTRGADAGEARARAALAGGRPGRALALDLSTLASRRDGILSALEALATTPRAVAELGRYAASIVGESEPELYEGLDLVSALLRDAARAATGRGALLHADVGPRIEKLGRALGAERAAEVVALADRLRGDLRLNLNRVLVCETVLSVVAGARLPVLTPTG
jgi:DNA polymerase-3 subunit delta'